MAWNAIVGLAKDFFRASYNVAAEQRARLVKIATWTAVLVVLGVIVVGIHTATGTPDPVHPSWELVILARAVLGRAFFAVGLFSLAVILAVVVFSALDNTDLGKRLMVWKMEEGNVLEPDVVLAEKKANAGRLLSVLILAAAIIFAGALR